MTGSWGQGYVLDGKVWVDFGGKGRDGDNVRYCAPGDQGSYRHSPTHTNNANHLMTRRNPPTPLGIYKVRWSVV